MRPALYVDNLYQASCAHEQKMHMHGLQWEQSIGMATMTNKKTLFVTLVMGLYQIIRNTFKLFFFLCDFD